MAFIVGDVPGGAIRKGAFLAGVENIGGGGGCVDPSGPAEPFAGEQNMAASIAGTVEFIIICGVEPLDLSAEVVTESDRPFETATSACSVLSGTPMGEQ